MSLSSYFFLELDTTPPVLEIYAPAYVTRDLDAEVIIQSNEILGTNEVYTIDNTGTKRSYTFSYDEETNQLKGIITFSDYPFGVSTIYVQAKDDVDNQSSVVSKEITVKESLTRLRLNMKQEIKYPQKHNQHAKFKMVVSQEG
jgi:hypothetical protein